METPRLTPDTQPPLGRAFYIWLLAPVLSMAVAVVSVMGDRNRELQDFGMVLSLATLVAMLVCSIVCSVMVGKRKGGGVGVLTFMGIQVFYISVAFAGCTVLMAKVGFP